MNPQSKTDISFKDCTTLEEIKERVKSSGKMTHQVSFGSLPAWYLYCFNSKAQYDEFVARRMSIIHIARKDYEGVNLMIR